MCITENARMRYINFFRENEKRKVLKTLDHFSHAKHFHFNIQICLDVEHSNRWHLTITLYTA